MKLCEWKNGSTESSDKQQEIETTEWEKMFVNPIW